MFFITLFIIIILAFILLGGYYFINQHINNIRANYELEIEDLKMEIYMNKRVALIPHKKIEAGTVIDENLVKIMEIQSSVSNENFMTEEDLGKIAKIDLLPSLPIFKGMISEEKIPDDIREEEFNMFLLSSNLKKNKYIDLRINYPNGEDYIVLSKKKIRDLNMENNTLWLWLNEEEILRASSAIVDAYLHKGSKLYTVIYVEPFVQKEAHITYPVNNQVLDLILDNPNIVDVAKTELTKEVRNLLDERLKKLDKEATNSMESSVRQEHSTRQQAINTEVEQQKSEEVPVVPDVNNDSEPANVKSSKQGTEKSEEEFYGEDN